MANNNHSNPQATDSRGRLARSHEKVETNSFLMIVLILAVISVAGLVEIVPLFFKKSLTQPVEGLKPYTALQLAGRDIYIREGCFTCHSQMIRPFHAETMRYGHFSLAGEFVYDRPFQWGSKRTGPDLHRIGGRYSDEWHRQHLKDPRSLRPYSNMPAYPWLADRMVDAETMPRRLRVLQILGHPYTDEEVAGAAQAVEGKTEMDALIAYLQILGTAVR
ncbi:Cbb3-type cytochrome oxidase, cytochrome c subunit [Serpentinimonas raichei]|uniref:Cbb3-type cytochrome oxidase, cytochrome c subunit n=1 Tax=Serpentinimonas raichei TaxID=1458425 RepID=A0A060NMG2_9BURK|nr:cytochrome-c oxidase, cbb3-type subunit II [Serpentinimonas raichei]BAO80708.1 Cbb3-type cytochrome oxidase, cytochrome c subunit [Serpentinimonas raichei]